MSRAMEITLEKEERDMIYNQLNARVMYFEEKMVQAANKKDTDRLLEIAEALVVIKSIMNKMLGVI